MEFQTSADPAEVWLRDDLENIYMLLFRFLGNGFRLALCSVGWLSTQNFVTLVPDPIVFAPWSVLHGCTASFVRTRSRYISPASLCGALWWYTTTNKDDMGDGVPTDQQSHHHCDWTDSPLQQPLCHFVCVCASRPKPLSQDDGGGDLAQCPRPKHFGTGSPCVTCHDTSHNASLPGRAAEDWQERLRQQPIAGLTLLALCCPIKTAPLVNVDYTSPCGAVFLSVPCPITSPSAGRPQRVWWTACKGDAVELLGDDDGCPKRGAPCGTSGKTHVTSWCVLSVTSATTQAISSLWLLGGNGDVGEIVKSLNDSGVLMMSTLVFLCDHVSQITIRFWFVVFLLCFFMW